MLGRWTGRTHLDPSQVGLFGFSAGGATGLVAIGGVPDMTRVRTHCAAHPEFVCTLMSSATAADAAPRWTSTPAVRAAVIAAPGLGFTFAPDGLRDAKVPVQLWQGAADTNVPPATNGGLVRARLPGRVDFHLVPKAGHAAFLAPCGPLAFAMPRRVCGDPSGFDRKAFHDTFNRSVVTFFNRQLGGAEPARAGP
jgi:predicted dienelactone hydrolase